MGESVLSLLWEGHTSELATVYTSLLENNFLVDCTISAGGQSLKAHKLVLCACSPYFQRLFLGETGKHTFLILLDATFETVKAVIDFMYQGETQIPQGSLKAFLTLAQTLEIKGLNNHSKNFTNSNVSSNTIENDPGNPSEDNEDIAQVPRVSAISEDNPENSSQLHPHCSETSNNAWHSIVNSGEHVAGNFTSEMDQRTPSIFGAQDLNQHSNGHKSSFENVQSTEMLPPQQRRRLRNEVMPDQDFDENEESLPPVAFISINEDCEEPSYVRLPDANERVQGAEPTRGGQNFLQSSNRRESSLGNMQSSEMLHPQQQHLQLGNEVSSARHFVEQEESLPPVVFIPVNEESEEPMDDRYLPVDDANERVEEIESTQSRHNFAQPSSDDVIVLEDDEPTHQQSGPRPRSHSAQESVTPPAQQQDARRAQTRQHPGERPSVAPGALPQTSFNLSALTRTPSREKPFACDMAYPHRKTLFNQRKKHTGERLYSCEWCELPFAQKHLTSHRRTHTGERRIAATSADTRSPGRTPCARTSASTRASGRIPASGASCPSPRNKTSPATGARTQESDRFAATSAATRSPGRTPCATTSASTRASGRIAATTAGRASTGRPASRSTSTRTRARCPTAARSVGWASAAKGAGPITRRSTPLSKATHSDNLCRCGRVENTLARNKFILSRVSLKRLKDGF
ncbi:hypothetical protein R5R35_004515 [Gryllus longicercus]|uniref:Uncharacterized protein n=1 Tax=Gryllus longicercus TaxID=2509291 RepID=A0AAN9VI09_9ORTH